MLIIKIAEMMGRRRFTQSQVAQATGIRPATVSAMWHGKCQRIEIEQIEKLCGLLNCQPSDLFSYVPDDKNPDTYHEEELRSRIMQEIELSTDPEDKEFENEGYGDDFEEDFSIIY